MYNNFLSPTLRHGRLKWLGHVLSKSHMTFDSLRLKKLASYFVVTHKHD